MLKNIIFTLLILSLYFHEMKAQEFHDFSSKGDQVDTDIIEQMDSLLTEFQFKMNYPDKKDTHELNKYNFRADEIPQYKPEEYKARLKELHTVIPLDYNSKVQSFIDLYTVRMRKLTSKLLGLQHVYFPMIEEVLYKKGLPMELKYLAVIESALNPYAVSRAKAVGLWQFIYSTGKMYGLKTNSFIDERQDPVKETYAAADYLKDLYNIYNDWQLAIAAYNCGPGRVNYAIRRSGGKTNFWQIWRYLPRETASYVPAFIAATYAMNYPQEHNLYPVWVDFTFNQDTLLIENKEIALQEISELTNTDFELLKKLNPELRRDRVPYSSDSYALRVPTKTAEFFRINGWDTLLNKASDLSNKMIVRHKVKKGESPGGIAEYYDVSVTDLKDWNYIKGKYVHPNQVLTLYVDSSYKEKKKEVAVVKEAENKYANNKYLYYKVQKGDSLWTIANRYNTSLDRLLATNNLRKNAILKIGQVIKVTQ